MTESLETLLRDAARRAAVELRDAINLSITNDDIRVKTEKVLFEFSDHIVDGIRQSVRNEIEIEAKKSAREQLCQVLAEMAGRFAP